MCKPVVCRPILLVEDDPRDLELTLLALGTCTAAGAVVVARDGAEALDYLHRRGRFADRPTGHPAAVLLDLKMPRVDGAEVLAAVRADPDLGSLPVVVLTASEEGRDRARADALTADAYLVKAVGFRDFVDTLRDVLGALGVAG